MDTPLHEVFFCVRPDADTAERLVAFARDLKRRHGLSGRPRPADLLHVSLALVSKTLGPPPRALIDLAIESASKVRAPPFAVKLNRVQGWNLNRARGPVVLIGDDGVIGLETLHRLITRAAGRRAPDPDFIPHLSLIWTSDPAPDHHDQSFVWTVREFVLVQSIHGQSRHEVLARFPLEAELKQDAGFAARGC